MNTDKLFKDLTNDPDIKDIPIEYIGRILLTVFRLLSNNKYSYDIGD